ncbi:PucR family transcriptional regulator [Paradesulfitobacterium ferrireducens]|uniref:PucR family transcriptional regulator n=1 Tax=Paradesulfitobacterium ferrireducens TaxID=2816476 RepID=UPI001A8E2572|nr:helix-turn-helix domain-containing protein [Paradesulfitobacterium ferrireducens]
MAEYTLQTQLLEAIACGRGMPSLAKIMVDFLGNPVIITDQFFRIVVYQTKRGENIHWDDFLPLSVTQRESKRWESKTERGMLVTPDGKTVPYASFPLVRSELEGFIVLLLTENAWSPAMALMLEQGALAVLVALKQEREIQRIHLKYKDEFIHDLLYNNFENREVLIQRGKTLGLDFSHPHALAVVGIDDEESPEAEKNLEQLKSLLHSSLRMHGDNPVVTRRGIYLIVLLPMARQLTFPELKRELNSLFRLAKQNVYNRLKTSFSVGVGHLYPAADELFRSYQEAKTALELGRFFNKSDEMTYFDELGVLSLIYKMGELELKAFCYSLLDPILDYDRKNAGQLLETLKIYFQCNADLNTTAEKLYVHVNTLRYRLKKVEELLGIDLNNLDGQLNLFTALRIFSQKGWN